MPQFRHGLEKDPDYLTDRKFSPKGNGYMSQYKPCKSKGKSIRPNPEGRFTPYEDTVIMAMLNRGHGSWEIAESLGRQVRAVEGRIRSLRADHQPIRRK